MQLVTQVRDGIPIAVVNGSEILISDVQSALDLLATVSWETGADRMIMKKEQLADQFFVLSSKLAGNVLQKFVNYHMKVAFMGDFSRYTSKPLKDFFYESNQGNHFYFVSTEEEALERLSEAI